MSIKSNNNELLEAALSFAAKGWRLVSVRMLKEDGTYFEAELLRPLSWIHRHQAQPGTVIELNMPELHVVGAAEVLSISACPPIDPGDGPVVLSTFKNTANNVLNIYVEGETEPIGVTAGHPIWSEDRQAFIHSDQLQPGERLRSALGKTVRITSIEIRAGPAPVYNLEVAGEHVYSVTDSGLLVHNTGPCDLNVVQQPRFSDASRWSTPFTASKTSKAVAAVNEASLASGLGGQNLFDVVRIHDGKSNFWVDPITKQWIVTLDTLVVGGKSRSNLLLEAAHELVHAQQFAKELARQDGDFLKAHKIFFSHPKGGFRYAVDEVVAEKLARERITNYLGNLSQSTIEESNISLTHFRKQVTRKRPKRKWR